MPILSMEDVGKLMQRAGFPQREWATGIAVATAESGRNTDAVNPAGRKDYGLWQINGVHNPTSRNWRDPAVNTAMAFKIWKDRGNWSPWTVYTSGAYRNHLPAATMAAARVPLVPGSVGTGLADIIKPGSGDVLPDPDKIFGDLTGLNDAISKVNAFFAFLSDANNWRRVGMFVAGLGLLVIALVSLVMSSRAAKSALRMVPASGVVRSVARAVT